MALQIKRLPVGQMQSNCYIIWDDEEDSAIIVDPGDEADYIVSQINRQRLSVGSIIATHGHFDHIMAVNELKLAFNAPFFIHKKDEFLLKRMRENAQHFLGIDPGPSPIADKYINKIESIFVGKYQLGIIETPGHTPGSICLYSKSESVIFTGDLIFANGAVGRTDFKYSSQKKLNESLKTVIGLPNSTVIYSGHDKETTIEKESLHFI